MKIVSDINNHVLGIDASNIRSGGGLTHLKELLSHADPNKYGFSKVIVWSCRRTLEQLPDVEWLDKKYVALLDGKLIFRIIWQRFILPTIANRNCDLLFVPGGNFHGSKVPFVAMSQNLLPFDDVERKRFRFTWTGVRLFLLKHGQLVCFQKASGVIFLTEFARKLVESKISSINGLISIVPHGVSDSFRFPPKFQKNADEYNFKSPFRFVYVSIIDFYKHQWNVIEAIGLLRSKGLPIAIDFIGPSHQRAMVKFKASIKKWDSRSEWVNYHGSCSHQDMPHFYRQADGVIFASSCENLPIILLEGMSSGLPVACSDRGPMPEVLKDGGVYFDPENVQSISRAISDLFLDVEKRRLCSESSFLSSKNFTWSLCASKTFSFFKGLLDNFYKI